MPILEPGNNILQAGELDRAKRATQDALKQRQVREDIHTVLTTAPAALPGGHRLATYYGGLSVDQQRAFRILYSISAVQQIIDKKTAGLTGDPQRATLRKLQEELYEVISDVVTPVRNELAAAVQKIEEQEQLMLQQEPALNNAITVVNSLATTAGVAVTAPLNGGTPPTGTDYTPYNTAFNTLIGTLRTTPAPGGMTATEWQGQIRSTETSWQQAYRAYSNAQTTRDRLTRNLVPPVPVGGATQIHDPAYHAGDLLNRLNTTLAALDATQAEDFATTSFQLARNGSDFELSINGRDIAAGTAGYTSYVNWILRHNHGDLDQEAIVKDFLVDQLSENNTIVPGPVLSAAPFSLPDPTNYMTIFEGDITSAPARYGIILRFIDEIVANYDGDDLDRDLNTAIDDLLDNRPLSIAGLPGGSVFAAPLQFFTGGERENRIRFLAVHLANGSADATFDRNGPVGAVKGFVTEQLKQRVKPQVERVVLDRSGTNGRITPMLNGHPLPTPRMGAAPAAPNIFTDYEYGAYFNHLLEKAGTDNLSDLERDYLTQVGQEVESALVSNAGPYNWIHHARTVVEEAHSPRTVDKYTHANDIATAIIDGIMVNIPMTGQYNPPAGVGGLGAGYNAGALGLNRMPTSHLNVFRWYYSQQNNIDSTSVNADDLRRVLVRSILDKEGVGGNVEAAQSALDAQTSIYARLRGRYQRREFLRRGLAYPAEWALQRFELGRTILSVFDPSEAEVGTARDNYQDTLNKKIVTTLADDYLYGENHEKDILNNDEHKREFMKSVVEQVLDARTNLVTSERVQFKQTWLQMGKSFYSRHKAAFALGALGLGAGAVGVGAIFGASAAPFMAGAAIATGVASWASVSHLTEGIVGKLTLWGRHRKNEDEIKGQIRSHRRTADGVSNQATDLTTLDAVLTGAGGATTANRRLYGPMRLLAAQIATHSNEKLYSVRYPDGRNVADNYLQWDDSVFLHDLYDQFRNEPAAINTPENKLDFMMRVIEHAVNVREEMLNREVEYAKKKLNNIAAASDVAAVFGSFGIAQGVNWLSENLLGFSISGDTPSGGENSSGGSGGSGGSSDVPGGKELDIPEGSEQPDSGEGKPEHDPKAAPVETNQEAAGGDRSVAATQAATQNQAAQVINFPGPIQADTIIKFEVPSGAINGDNTPGLWKIVEAALDLSPDQTKQTYQYLTDIVVPSGDTSLIRDGEMLQINGETLARLAEIKGGGATPDSVAQLLQGAASRFSAAA